LPWASDTAQSAERKRRHAAVGLAREQIIGDFSSVREQKACRVELRVGRYTMSANPGPGKGGAGDNDSPIPDSTADKTDD